MYRSDGIISYTKSEVESDKKLANYLGIPLVRIVVISKDKLLDNNTLFSYEAKGDSIFVNQAKKSCHLRKILFKSKLYGEFFIMVLQELVCVNESVS